MTSPAVSRGAERGLDVLNLFVANIQTGFGPFIAVYLTSRGWTQTAIGVALSIGTIVAMASQIPAGGIVDATRMKSSVAGLSLLAFAACALILALTPVPLFVFAAEALHGFSSCTLGPSVAALSLALTGQAGLAVRLGRNARFSAIGNAMGAALMGACGYYLSNRSVFFLTALLVLPALLAIVPLRALDRETKSAKKPRRHTMHGIVRLTTDRRLAIFALFAMLFTFANAAILPIAGGAITERAPGWASLLIAAFIVLPQLAVAASSTRIGALADTIGRRPIFILALASLSLRGFLFAAIGNPVLLIPCQLLDGVSAACFGILVPLVTSDLTARSGHYNLSLGMVGFAIGIGATLSTTVAGLIADRFGQPATLLMLALVATATTILAAAILPETRPGTEKQDAGSEESRRSSRRLREPATSTTSVTCGPGPESRGSQQISD